MFVCVALSHYHHVLCLYTIFYQEPRSEPHQRGHLGGEQKHRFDVARKVRTLFPNDETPNLVCLFLAFPHFLSCFPIFFSYFFMVHMFSFLVALIGPSEGPLDFIGTFVRVFRSLCYDGVGPVFNPVHFAAIFEFGFSFKSLENDLRSKSCNTISRKRY